jgi:hypothetical protein
MSTLPSMTAQRQGGRKSKGDRRAHSIRFPVDLYETIVDAAAAAGYSNLNDFVVDLVDQAHREGRFPPAGGQLPLSA